MAETTVALVTGANNGTGYEVARQLAGQGVTVLLGARDHGRGQAAADALRAEGAAVTFVPLDVTDADSVSAAATAVERAHGRLDILVNNAGILAESGPAPSAATPEVLRRTYETNVVGVLAVTNAMLPLLRRSPAARIVNLSSELGSLTLTTTPGTHYAAYPLVAYNSSKSAVNALTVSYANELRDTGITVNSVTPGYCATDLNGHSGPRSAAEGAAVVVDLAIRPTGAVTGGFFGAEGVLPW
ncbi:MAG TPA: SDR family oxidoreductase [Pilimelia sp.]|nr:SDR family oxidoreductase [Pilimelia sp.]